jgi:glycosyltransferase involved in cell wall biosynthesis
LEYRLENRLIRSGINRLIVPSELAKREFAATRYPLDRIDVIYPGVDIPDLSIPAPDRVSLGLPEGPLATMIAPVAPEQGYEILLDAVPRLVQRVPEAQIAVLGAGPLLEQMQNKARSSNPPMPITWLGDQPDMRAVIRASNVLIAHPRRDGIPRSLVEATIAAKPVVASRVPGVTEIVEQNITGFLVTPADSRDFAIQIGRLLTQPEAAAHLGAAARRRAEQRFSLPTQRETLTILYESTIYASR